VRSLIRILISFLAFILCVYGVAFILSVMLSTSQTSTTMINVIPNFQDTIGYVLFYLAPAVLALWIMTKYFDKTSWMEFGFHFSKAWWLDLLAGILIGSVQVVLVLLVEKAFGLVRILPNTTFNEISANLAVYLIANALTLLAGIIAQDIIIRGYVIKNLSQGLNWNAKLRKWAPVIGLFVFSILFCYLRMKGYPFRGSI